MEVIHVFNKLDKVDEHTRESLERRNPDAVFISATRDEGIDTLRERIEGHFFGRNLQVEVKLSAGNGRSIARVRELLHNVMHSYSEDICIISGTIGSHMLAHLESVDGVTIRYFL